MDRQNAEIRAAIAAKAREVHGRVLAWAWELFGEGWLPRGRHFLVEKSEEEARRRDGGQIGAAATVYTARNDAGDKRHFTVDADGRPHECASYEEGFGSMLLEPDLTRTIEVRGQQVHPHRFSLCWGGYELYEPRTAEQLAAAREKREVKAIAKEADQNPLFADLIKSGEWRQQKKPRGRS